MDLKLKFKKYKEIIVKLEKNIIHKINKSRRLFASLILLFFGGFLYIRFMNDKNISGVWSLILIAVVYFCLGIGLYGLFSWLVVKIFQLISYIFRLIYKGQIQFTVSKGKLSSKLTYK